MRQTRIYLAVAALVVTMQTNAAVAALPSVVQGLADKITSAQGMSTATRLYNQALTGDPDALPALTALARSGTPEAMFRVGFIFDRGLSGVPQNFSAAANWYKQAADKGHSLATYNFGLLLFKGRGVQQNVEAAMQYFNSALQREPNIAQASVRLAIHLLQKDKRRAWELLMDAANRGDPIAKYHVGRMQLTGEAGHKDHVEARKMLNQSADKLNADAQWMLGFMYENGLGVEQDPVEAAAWKYIAASTNSKSYGQRVNHYVVGLDEEDRSRARNKARQWLSSHQNRPLVFDYENTIDTIDGAAEK